MSEKRGLDSMSKLPKSKKPKPIPEGCRQNSLSTYDAALLVDQKLLISSMDPVVSEVPSILGSSVDVSAQKCKDDFEGDEELENTLCNLLDNFEKNIRAKEVKKIINQRYKLVDDIVFPLTKSGSKFISVGIKPFPDYEPVVKIFNAQNTSAVVFNQGEFSEFLKKMTEFVPLVRDIEFDVFLCELQKYKTFISKKKVINFQAKFRDVYQPMYLSVETLQTILNTSSLFLTLLRERTCKENFYVNYEMFVNNLSLHGGGDDKLFDSTAFNFIKTK